MPGVIDKEVVPIFVETSHCCRPSHRSWIPTGMKLITPWLVIVVDLWLCSADMGETKVPSVTPKLQPVTNDGNAGSCGVWLAPSTIPGAGLGMFAGKNYSVGDELLTDLVIAISDITLHNRDVDYGPFLWDEYTWSGGALKLHGEGVSDVNVASPGFGAAANCILALVNVEEYSPLPDDWALHQRDNPTTGAITAHHRRKSSARLAITAGSEFLVSYGPDWFTSRTQLGPIPLYEEFGEASVLLKRFQELQVAESIAAEVWDTFIQKTAFRSSRVLVGALGNVSYTTFQTVHRDIHTNNVTAVKAADAQHSLEWLTEHGTCGDNIVPAVSTHAGGYGAFTQRPIKAGTVVAPVPLIHIKDRSRLDIYEVNRTEWNSVLADQGPISQQLLLNYCYGHAESTVLLCPYGPMASFVNHNRTQANVRLQWADPKRSNHHPVLLTRPVSELPESSSQLAMEMVALRDLEVGEEVFLDYGEAWETAWQQHVLDWDPSPAELAQQPSAELNQKTFVYPTVFEELRERTTPRHVEMQCDVAFHQHAQDCAHHREEGTIGKYLHDTEASWWNCDVLRRNEDDPNQHIYAVYMHSDSEKIVVENVTVEGLHFVDRPYTSNTFLRQAFRHDVRIPDNIFPEKWKNRKQNMVLSTTCSAVRRQIPAWASVLDRGLSLVCSSNGSR